MNNIEIRERINSIKRLIDDPRRSDREARRLASVMLEMLGDVVVMRPDDSTRSLRGVVADYMRRHAGAVAEANRPIWEEPENF